jgi:hypothetical protein
VTVRGIVATVVLLEVKFIVKPPAGAGNDRFNIKAWVVVPTMLTVLGKKLARAVTCTIWLVGG